jgi:hypothetical protein
MTLAHAPEGAVRVARLDESSPDSGNLRVSVDTSLESGIPPARERLARRTDSDAALEQLELVLVESTRAEANLGLLLRGLKHLAAGAGSAQEANAVLMQELEGLRQRMTKVYESETLLKQRVQLLENTLDVTARERESCQHERRLAELDLAFDELRQQYQNAKTDVQRLTYERDAAVALLNEPLETLESVEGPSSSPPLVSSVRLPPPLPPASSPSSSGLRLGSVKLPALKAKPDAVSSPLGGYSMTSDDLDDELDKRATARPPRP